MFSDKIRIAGVLLVAAHCCQSFVLLTANIEDVKKIARKFVSEPMAQQIADFIQKAASQQGQLVTNSNVSEENEQNVEKMDSLSDNDPIGKVQRQGPAVELKTAVYDFTHETQPNEQTSKRYRKLSRPTTTSRAPPSPAYELPPPPPHYGASENRSPKKQQAELRQNIKKRWTPIQRDKTLYDEPASTTHRAHTGDTKTKQQAEEQIRQHQKLQKQLENLQSQVKVGTMGEALETMNTNPKPSRLQKLQKKFKLQKPLQKRLPKPSDQQQYQLLPMKQQQNQYPQVRNQQNQYLQNRYQPNQYQQNQNKVYPKIQQKLPRLQKPQQPIKNRIQQYPVKQHETNYQTGRTIRQQQKPRQPEEPNEEEATEQSQYLRDEHQKTNENDPIVEQADADLNEEKNDEPEQKDDDQMDAEQEEEQKEAEPEEEQQEDDTEPTQLSEVATSKYEPDYQTPPKRRKTRNRVRGRFALQDNTETAPTMVIQFSNPNADPAEITTEKEKNEFDQYDMRAPGLVATSGPVVLKAADWPDELQARAQAKEEEADDGPSFQVAPVPARISEVEDQNEKSTVVINLVANVEDDTEAPAETETTSTFGTDFGDLSNMGNLI